MKYSINNPNFDFKMILIFLNGFEFSLFNKFIEILEVNELITFNFPLILKLIIQIIGFNDEILVL